jgi:hypothetical protein
MSSGKSESHTSFDTSRNVYKTKKSGGTHGYTDVSLPSNDRGGPQIEQSDLIALNN